MDSLTFDMHLDLEPFTCFQSLVHLGIGPAPAKVVGYAPPLSEMLPQSSAALTKMNTLKSLHLHVVTASGSMWLESITLSTFPHLTALCLCCAVLDVLSLAVFNLEGLRDLTLLCQTPLLGPERVSVLARATGLIRLSFRDGDGRHSGVLMTLVDLRVPLSCMTRLQTLSLEAISPCGTSFSEAIRILTALTMLEWSGGYITDDDVRVCVGLKKLRVLSLLPEYPAPLHIITPGSYLAWQSSPR